MTLLRVSCRNLNRLRICATPWIHATLVLQLTGTDPTKREEQSFLLHEVLKTQPYQLDPHKAVPEVSKIGNL